MISLLNFNELTDTQRLEFFNFLKKESESNLPAAINMCVEDWESKPNTLLYKLNEGVFNDGLFHVAFDNESIIACSGVYRSTFNSNIAIAGARTWINQSYKNKNIARDYMLPAQKQWAVDHDVQIIALTFNDYNSNLIQAFKRKRLGENRTKREPHHMFYNGVNEVSFPVNIQYTKQYVIYEKLSDWDFDWESIKHSQQDPAL